MNTMANLLHSDRFRHRTYVVEAGQTISTVYFCTKGLMRTYRTTPEGDELTSSIIHEGQMLFIHQSILTDEPSPITVQTLEPTILYGTPYDQLKLAATQHEEINQLLQAILEHTIMQQEAYQLMLMAHPKDKYLALTQADPEVIRRTPLKFIASYLHMAPETLSRVRSTLLR